jgi:predicted RNA-binding protein Jag
VSDRRRIIRPMGMEDTIALKGNWDDRVVQLLRMARHFARLSQIGARGHKLDALNELDDVVTDQLAALGHADEDDKSEAEESGEAERERRAWRPLRAA